MRRLVFIVTLLVAGLAYAGQLTNQAEEERAIRTVLATFYAGWNAHDPDAMVSVPCQTNRLSFNQIQAIRDLVHVAPVEGKGEHARQVRRLDCSSLTIRVI